MSSRLLDMRECASPEFRGVYADMLRLSLRQQPAWFRPLLVRSRRLKSMTGYDHWSRAWEYPWAVQAAALGSAQHQGASHAAALRILDVGGGGSPFAPYLAGRGFEAHVADPSLDLGRDYAWDPKRSAYKNARTVAKRLAFKAAGIRSLWGLPRGANGRLPLHYHPFTAERLQFPDAHFDRVFCLSVIEHIPRDLWPACMREFTRVLKPGGRLVISMDMEYDEANARLYRALVDATPLRLLGDPNYAVPLLEADQQRRHPSNYYETLGLVWLK